MSAIPSNAQYSLKPNAVKIERRQTSIPSLNKRSYSMGTSSGETIIFYLPALANSVVDMQNAYLRFDLNIFNANAGADRTITLDHGAWCVFQSLRIYGPGGSLIEEIDEMNVLYNALIDIMSEQGSKLSHSTAWGTEEEYELAVTDLRADSANSTKAALDAQLRTTLINQNRKGRSIFCLRNSDTRVSFSIPILSCLTMLDKFLPTFALQDDIRLEFQLGSVVTSFVSASVADLTITVENPEMVCDYLFMDPATLAQVQSFYAGRDLVLHTTSYHAYSSTIPQGASGNIQQIIPSKLVSAKYLLGVFRPSIHTQNQAAYSLSSRVCPFYSVNDKFSLNIGGINVPNHGIQTYAANSLDMFFTELQKALHALGVDAHNGSLTRSYYNVNTAAFGDAPAPADGASSYRNGFILGVNLDAVIKASDIVMSGTDLSRVTTYAQYRIGAGSNAALGAAGIATTFFINHDQLLVVGQDGSMSTRF